MPIYNGTNTLKTCWESVGHDDIREVRRVRGWGGWQRLPDGIEPVPCAFASYDFVKQGDKKTEQVTQCSAVAVWTWGGRTCYCDEHRQLLYDRGMRERGRGKQCTTTPNEGEDE